MQGLYYTPTSFIHFRCYHPPLIKVECFVRKFKSNSICDSSNFPLRTDCKSLVCLVILFSKLFLWGQSLHVKKYLLWKSQEHNSTCEAVTIYCPVNLQDWRIFMNDSLFWIIKTVVKYILFSNRCQMQICLKMYLLSFL